MGFPFRLCRSTWYANPTVRLFMFCKWRLMGSTNAVTALDRRLRWNSGKIRGLTNFLMTLHSQSHLLIIRRRRRPRGEGVVLIISKTGDNRIALLWH
jgi:hypothetical protein